MSKSTGLSGLLSRARAKAQDDDEDEGMETEAQAEEQAKAEDEGMEAAAQDDDEEEDDSAPMADDGDGGESDSKARAARGRERARVGRILRSDAAEGRMAMAIELAVGTSLSSAQAVAILGKAEKRQPKQSRLDKAMAAVKQPDVGPGGAPDKRSGLAAAGDAELKRRGLQRVAR